VERFLSDTIKSHANEAAAPNGRRRPEPKPVVAVEVPEFLDAKHKPEIVMAPRAYWKGSLKLSLVSCPVALYPATTSTEKTHFHMINKETGNRLKQQMVDAGTGDVVEGDQKARGYELKKGEYVEVEKEELDAVQIESSHIIDIDGFVPEDEIDKRYIDHPYYIVPDGNAGIDAFAVIRDAMKNKDRVALARIVLTNREHIIAIEPLGKGLLGITLRYPYEVRDEHEYFDDIKNPKISKDMIELASHILDTKAAHFDPSKFKDEYENALKTLVRRKAAGKPVKAAEREERPDNVISLMDALQQSLKGRSSAKRRSPARRTTHRIAKKAHRSTARARKAG
jgi:Ku protein